MKVNISKRAPSSPDETEDSLYDGQLRLRQPALGYRFAVDAPLLTAFAAQGKRARLACDLGAGCGVVGLGLLFCGAAQRLVAVELQKELAGLALRNAQDNNLGDRVEVIHSDLRAFGKAEKATRFDLVVCNPPYFPPDEGHLPQHEGRRIAGFEIEGALGDFLSCGLRLLGSKGRLCLVYPCRRLDVLLSIAVERGFGVSRLRVVHPVEGRAGELVLAELRPGKPGRAEVGSPLVLRTPDGQDTPEAAAILSGRFALS
jgi:tRNA1Val (adenine37-N6)-methyltransferase